MLASLEREGAAEKFGRRPAASRLEPKLRVDRILRQQVLEPRRGAVGGVAEPVDATAREDDEVSRAKARLVSVVAYLEPARAGCDDVERGETVRLDAEAPRRAQGRAAVDATRDAEIAKQGIDLVGLDRAREQFRQRDSPWPLAASR
jgi:hypothetical protein